MIASDLSSNRCNMITWSSIECDNKCIQANFSNRRSSSVSSHMHALCQIAAWAFGDRHIGHYLLFLCNFQDMRHIRLRPLDDRHWRRIAIFFHHENHLFTNRNSRPGFKYLRPGRRGVCGHFHAKEIPTLRVLFAACGPGRAT